MKYEEIKITIPTDWEDISIGMYQKFAKLQKEKLSEEEFGVEVVAALCNIDKETLAKFSYKDLKSIVTNLMKLLDTDFKEKELVKKLDFKDTKYGIIPNLSEITLGEYVDIEGYCKDAHNNLHKIMSIMYRPIVKEKGDRYSVEEYSPDEYKEDVFKDFPITVSMSALNFFFLLCKKLRLSLFNCLMKEKEREIKKLKRLVPNGVGII